MGSPAALPFRHLHEAASEVAAAVCWKGDAEARQLLKAYVGSVLGYAGCRLAVARGLFLPAVYGWLGYLERRAMMPAAARQQLIDDFLAAIEAAGTASQLTDAVNATFERVLVARRSSDGTKVLRLETALTYVDEHFTRSLCIEEVARRSGFSVQAFAALFRQRTGRSFLRYVRALRVEHATDLLRHTDLAPKEIAAASGFESPRIMVHAFQVTTGRTPRLFRTLAPDQQVPCPRTRAVPELQQAV